MNLRLLAANVDIEAWRVVVVIGLHAEESGELTQLRRKLRAGIIHFLRIDPGNRECVLSLILVGGSRADFKHRKRSEKCRYARNRTDAPHQLRDFSLDRRTRVRRL